MPSLKQNVTMWQGDARTLVIDVKNTDGTIPSLVGASVTWWMGANPPTSAVHIKKDNGNTGGVTITATPGEFSVVLAGADTATLSPGVYYHEAEVVLADGTPSTVTIGQFTIMPALIP
jgi:hypothetical protein